MILYKITLLVCCFSVVSCLTDLEEIQEQKQNGTFRWACYSSGYATQPERRANTTVRLSNLRKVMNDSIALEMPVIDAYIVTSTDEHQNMDVEPYEKRRQYISGFSGSYGDAIITQKEAALWTDGRYHLQADEELDCNWYLFREGHKNIPTMTTWIRKNVPENGTIGINPKLVSQYMWEHLLSELENTTLKLVELKVDPIDKIWPKKERGSKISKRALIIGNELTGKDYVIKINETRSQMQELGANAMVITALDEIAWLLNIRGRDVPYAPFLRSYVILDIRYIFLYVNKKKISNDIKKYLDSKTNLAGPNSVQLREYEEFWNDLATKCQRYNKILVPYHSIYSDGANHEVFRKIPYEKRKAVESPIIKLKAVKNSVEIRAMKDANIMDGAAVCACMAYIEKLKMKGGEDVYETDLVQYLDEFRYEQLNSTGISFKTKVAFGPSGAYPRYEPTPIKTVRVFPNSTVILDSGGQYYGGTTVVTRTVHYGEPTDAMKEAYTRVLIGIIQLSSLTFPDNTKAAVVDALTRASLWQVGLDYEQETGHGIGLGTHESSVKVHYDSEYSMNKIFKPGYFVTNAPGFYSEGEFGVRLENTLEVYEEKWLARSSGYKFLAFRPITLVPFEPNLIKLSLLTTPQRIWLNNYNAQVRFLVGAELKKYDRKDGFYWMMEKTKYIPEHGQSNIITTQPLLLVVTSTALVVKTYIL